MKLSIFMGSPRSTGNTAMLLAPFLDECARLGAETERVELYQRVIQPCLGCMVCQDCMDGPGCVQRDDFDDLFHKMTNSDAVVLATPIYAWYCTPPMKALLDRAIYAGNKNYGREKGPALLKGLRVASIVTCGYRPEKGADLWEEGLRRFCRHSRAVYLVQDGEMGPFTARAQEVGAQLTLVRQFEAVSLYTSDRQLMQPPQETPQS